MGRQAGYLALSAFAFSCHSGGGPGVDLILAGTVIAAKARSRPRPGRRSEGVTVESPE